MRAYANRKGCTLPGEILDFAPDCGKEFCYPANLLPPQAFLQAGGWIEFGGRGVIFAGHDLSEPLIFPTSGD